MTYTPSPFTFALLADRLARRGGQMDLMFALMTTVSLGAIAYCAIQLTKDDNRSLRGR